MQPQLCESVPEEIKEVMAENDSTDFGVLNVCYPRPRLRFQEATKN